MTTNIEKNFQIETFDRKSDREDRRHELATRRNDDGSIGRPGLVHFSGVRVQSTIDDYSVYASTWSIAWPIRLSARRRERDWSIATGPCPKKQRRSRYWRRHPALHAKQRDMIRKSFVVPQ